MQSHLAVILLVVGCFQEDDGQERPTVRTQVIRVAVGNVKIGGQREIRQLTLEIPIPPSDDDGNQPPQPALRIDVMSAVLARENFDRWAFAEGGNNAAAAKRILNDLLRRKVESAAMERKLTQTQQAKLLLAGKGDITGPARTFVTIW
jgi:hypothetical protein